MTRILLVEDDKSLREIYGVRLVAEGYDIISAGDGEEALAMAIKDRPSLIISDVMMPKISGFDMLDILRSTTETRNIKVIMMTALSSEDQRQRGESLGADRYLVKSQVGIEDVVRIVHEVLDDAEAMGKAGATPLNVPQVQPAPAPQPQPAQQAQPAPQTQGYSYQQPNEPGSANPLPQPIAPFSSKRTGSLGDRVIQPLERQEDPFAVPIADQMNQELSATGVSSSDATQQPQQQPNPAADQTAGPAPQAQPTDNPGPFPAPTQPAPEPQMDDDTATTTDLPPVAPPPAPVATPSPEPEQLTPSDIAPSLDPPTVPQPAAEPSADVFPTTDPNASISADEADIAAHLTFDSTSPETEDTAKPDDPDLQAVAQEVNQAADPASTTPPAPSVPSETTPAPAATTPPTAN